MASELVAHSPNAHGAWHTLREHLAAVGDMAGEFASAWGAREAGRFVGEVHDLGKADPAWQQYLHEAAAGKPARSVDHKRAGAALALEANVPELAPLVLGHHGGLSDLAVVREVLRAELTAGQQRAVAASQSLGIALPQTPLAIEAPSSRSDANGARRLEFWMRMVFSALIDADRIDTARHYNRGGETVTGVDIATLYDLASLKRVEIVSTQTSDPVASAREGLFQEVMENVGRPAGWFEFTAPTGAGKTIAGLLFALAHAARNGQRRVVTAVPFVSVTQQVAGVYRSLLQQHEEAVLEHHSGVYTTSESQVGDHLQTRLATENWDASIIVTTTVQLLESLFENSTSRVRKLHRIANSVIVLDEVQSMPWRLLLPTLDVLMELVRNYGCSVVLSTATQPPFERVGSVEGVERRPLSSAKWHPYFRRVTADVVEGRPGWDDVVSRILDEADRHNGQCLAVFNTVRDAREVTGLLAPRVGLVHMSTRLCPRHRAKQLELVHRLLAADQPCIVVATQVIEAGIDVDFPVGLRAFGPMPAIAQVAGRVNRAGRTPGARLVLVDPADGHVPPDEYRVATDITRDLLRQGRDPLDPASLDEFYDRFLHVASDKFDFWGIQRERELLNFARVAELYRVIVDETVPVVVPFEDFDPFDVKIPDDPRRRRDLYRQIQPYCVSLRRREFDRALAVGMAVPIEMGLHAWVGGYDPQLMGLQSERSEEALVW